MKNKFNLPVLDIYIAIPFVRIETAIMSDVDFGREREYVKLIITIHRWTAGFRLYNIIKYRR